MRTLIATALIAALLPSALVAAPPAQPRIVTLAKDVITATPLAGKQALYADVDNKLWRVDAETGQRQAWPCDWSPAADGWDTTGSVFQMHASADGQWVYFAQAVGADVDKLSGGKPVSGMLPFIQQIWAVAVVLARTDGSTAHAVGLGIEAGGGPQYDFNTASTRLFGQFEPCLPDAKHFFEYCYAGWETPSLERFNYVDIATGERGSVKDLPISDGFWKCPYSDYFRAENNDYDTHEFSTFDGGGIVGKFSGPPPEGHGNMRGWVLEDAALISEFGGQGLLYVDGTFKMAPKPIWDVRCWLPDGTYIFSDDGGASLKYGKVDWSSLSVDWYVPRPDLTQYADARWLPLPDSSGVLILDWNSGKLLYTPLSRAGSKP
jgi:hypothetical protein